ncbi:MAG: sigma factor, partial [Chloroflexota bacterium]
MSTPSPGRPASRTPPLPNEDAVIVRAASGDRAAFTQLVEHYQSACYGLAWRLLGDADQAADAAQDAFVHAYGAIAKYRGGLFRSWLLRITA